MASFTKHLSTHVYFHMDRPVPKKTGPPPTGFGMQHTALENTVAPPGSGLGLGLGGSGRPQTLRSRSKEHVPQSTLPTTNAFERLNRTLRAGGDPFQDQVFNSGDEDYESRFDTSDYFSENPYLLSPDFAARDRNSRSRRVPWKRSNKYELKSPSPHELQNYGVYSNRYGGEPSRNTSGGGGSGGNHHAQHHHHDRNVSFASDNRSSSGGSGGDRSDRGDRNTVHFAPEPTSSSNRRQSSVQRSYYDDHQEVDVLSSPLSDDLMPNQDVSVVNSGVGDLVSGSGGGGDGSGDKNASFASRLDQDCFIIPAHKMDRFLPMQHKDNAQALSRLEIRDIKTCIVIDFGENATFASQDLPSPVMGGPLSLAPKEWTSSQLGRQRKLFAWVRDSRCSNEGMLLMNVERHCQFPFVSYLVLNTGQGDPRRVINQLESEVNNGQTHEDHHIAGYEEVAAIARPPVDMRNPSKTACSMKTGYIISAFRVFPGEDSAKLERSWLTWTGARQIYKRLPKHLGLRRIAFHKKIFPERGITYVLMCECTSLMDYVTEACCFVDQLRARCCGYTALYRVADFF